MDRARKSIKGSSQLKPASGSSSLREFRDALHDQYPFLTRKAINELGNDLLSEISSYVSRGYHISLAKIDDDDDGLLDVIVLTTERDQITISTKGEGNK